jgi:hypothetical protein
MMISMTDPDNDLKIEKTIAARHKNDSARTHDLEHHQSQSGRWPTIFPDAVKARRQAAAAIIPSPALPPANM